MVAKWAERIPDGFVMHVKAFGMMTRHPVKADVLPPELREAAPVDDRGRVDRPPRDPDRPQRFLGTRCCRFAHNLAHAPDRGHLRTRVGRRNRDNGQGG